MHDAATLRVLDTGPASRVITLAGVVDGSWTGPLASEIDRRAGRRVIVDLLDATSIDPEVHSFLISAAESTPLTIVAEAWLLHVFELTRHSRALALGRSLAEAVAAPA
jgi:hypothetical protein